MCRLIDGGHRQRNRGQYKRRNRSKGLVRMPNWKVYDRKSKPRVVQPLVTLQAAGTFSVNEASYEELGRPSQVELLYDEDEQLVGLRPADEQSPHSYPIKPQPNGRTFQTGGKAFCNYFGIPIGQARRFSAQMEDGVLTIDLKENPVVVGRNGRRSKVD